MSIPVAFAFDLASVLVQEEAYFSPSNFSHCDHDPWNGDEQFEGLDFSKIYHDTALSDDSKAAILEAREAEVLVQNEISLSFCKALIVRSHPEKRTLQHLLSGRNLRSPRIVVETQGSVFYRRGIYLNDIYKRGDDLFFRFGHPTVGKQEKYEVAIQQGDVTSTYPLEPRLWKVKLPHHDEIAVKVNIEGHLAYHALPRVEETKLV